jgi:hypothetical protein
MGRLFNNVKIMEYQLSDKIRIFSQAFSGREDVVQKFWQSKDSEKSGYNPLCMNQWKKGICHRPCKNCENQDYIPMSDELVENHFRGKHILGIYPLLSDGTCNFMASHFDKDDDVVGLSLLHDVKRFFEACELHKIYCYIFRSKSGKGYHVYTFFDGAVPVWKARAVCLAMLEEAEILELTDGIGFDGLVPGNDTGFGNFVELPFQGSAARNGGHTMILDPGTGFRDVYENHKQWNILENLEKVSEGQLDVIVQEWNLYERSDMVNEYVRIHSK